MTRFQWAYLRLLGRAEGFSLLFLLLVAMPARAITRDPSIVQAAGTVHGLLFLMYAYTLADAAVSERWRKAVLLTGIAASCVPLGAFWFERRVFAWKQGA